MKSSYKFMQGASKYNRKKPWNQGFFCVLPLLFYQRILKIYLVCKKKFFCSSVIQSLYSITSRSKAKDLALFHTELSLLFKQSNVSSSSQSTPDIYLDLHLVQNVQESKGLLYQEEHLCPSSLCLYL